MCVKNAPTIKIEIPSDPIITIAFTLECIMIENDIFKIPTKSLNHVVHVDKLFMNI